MEKLTGLRVDHTVVVDFKVFASLTEVVGGVRVCLPNDIYQGDLNPNRATKGKLLFKKGEQTVSGQEALDYVRIRHGIGDGSDIGRIKRQQAFVGSLIKTVKSDGLTPTKLLPLAEAATNSMTVDPGLGTANKLISFAMSLKNIDLHNTKFVTIPWRYDGSRVAIVEPDASALWAALKADRTIDGKDAGGTKSTATAAASASPSAAESISGEGIAVTVYNGTTTTGGLASTAATKLTRHGFTVTGTANADSQDHTTTVVEYRSGLKAQADGRPALPRRRTPVHHRLRHQRRPGRVLHRGRRPLRLGHPDRRPDLCRGRRTFGGRRPVLRPVVRLGRLNRTSEISAVLDEPGRPSTRWCRARGRRPAEGSRGPAAV